MFGVELQACGLLCDYHIDTKGKLMVHDICGDKSMAGELDPFNPHPKAQAWFAEHVWPYVKIYSFADIMKKNVCIDLLGLRYEQVYGTDEEKNAPTHIRWCDMPLSRHIATTTSLRKQHLENESYMSARQILQYLGTDVFRRMDEKVHAKATIQRILNENSELAIICDMRFPNELDVVKEHGGKVIRLTRYEHTETNQESEYSMDPGRYDHSNFDYVLNNDNLSIGHQNEAVSKKLAEWGFPNYH